MNYVIIGGGAAAVSCIDGIRSRDREGGITVISKEAHPAYFRPLISYYLEGKSKKDNIFCRDADFYEKNGCEVVYGTVTEMYQDQKAVVLSDGSKIPYDRLCICTGSSPFVPPMKGIESVDKRFTFLTIDDAFAIERAVDQNSRVLIVGAGLIGLKCAEGLRDRVKQVTVCDLAPRVLSSILDDECAAMVQKHLERCGIRFSLSNTAERFEGNLALMKDGSVIDFDVLVLALGVRPNIGFFKEAGGACNRAILVDNRMSTSVEGIYAAGDCVEQEDITCGAKRVMALLPNANLGGYTAGVNMAGGDRLFDNALPMNSIGFWGLHMMTAGTYSNDGNAHMTERKTDSSVKRFFIRDNRLVGFIIIGDVKSAGIYTNLIRNQTDLSDLNTDALIENPNLLPFGEIYRRKTLGGVV
ncbi:NAD(P)/FAD-dependent oxidoreductase [Ruminococcus sp.]|uniref:NAD(P)/FAD-dependent oxidoreductase n=1 Tax=Ruminococcus sp. TaxID=41978 RepID=UPI00388D3D11